MNIDPSDAIAAFICLTVMCLSAWVVCVLADNDEPTDAATEVER